MRKLPWPSTSLGMHLQQARNACQCTQRTLAQQAHVSPPTLRLLEHGQGNLTSFWAVLHTLNLDIVGRNLPPGPHIGERILTWRQRKGMSQRELSQFVGVSPPTLLALERHGTGHVPTLERVLVALGAGASLAPSGHTPACDVHAEHAAHPQRWDTPKEVLAPLSSVFGGFDLDPCSPTSGRTAPVRAQVYYTQDDDGLSLPGFGRVFCHPPYGRSLSRWTAKANAEVEQGNAAVVVGILPARLDTQYWHRDVAGSARVFILKGRLKLGEAEHVAPLPSCLVVWGAAEEVMTAIHTAFPEAWRSR